MTESLLLWGKAACMALHFVALCGAVVGACLLGCSFEAPKNRTGIRAGAWVLAVCTLLLVALPWRPVWDAWIELARRP